MLVRLWPSVTSLCPAPSPPPDPLGYICDFCYHLPADDTRSVHLSFPDHLFTAYRNLQWESHRHFKDALSGIALTSFFPGLLFLPLCLVHDAIIHLEAHPGTWVSVSTFETWFSLLHTKPELPPVICACNAVPHPRPCLPG